MNSPLPRVVSRAGVDPKTKAGARLAMLQALFQRKFDHGDTAPEAMDNAARLFVDEIEKFETDFGKADELVDPEVRVMALLTLCHAIDDRFKAALSERDANQYLDRVEAWSEHGRASDASADLDALFEALQLAQDRQSELATQARALWRNANRLLPSSMTKLTDRILTSSVFDCCFAGHQIHLASLQHRADLYRALGPELQRLRDEFSDLHNLGLAIGGMLKTDADYTEDRQIEGGHIKLAAEAAPVLDGLRDAINGTVALVETLGRQLHDASGVDANDKAFAITWLESVEQNMIRAGAAAQEMRAWLPAPRVRLRFDWEQPSPSGHGAGSSRRAANTKQARRERAAMTPKPLEAGPEVWVVGSNGMHARATVQADGSARVGDMSFRRNKGSWVLQSPETQPLQAPGSSTVRASDTQRQLSYAESLLAQKSKAFEDLGRWKEARDRCHPNTSWNKIHCATGTWEERAAKMKAHAARMRESAAALQGNAGTRRELNAAAGNLSALAADIDDVIRKTRAPSNRASLIQFYPKPEAALCRELIEQGSLASVSPAQVLPSTAHDHVLECKIQPGPAVRDDGTPAPAWYLHIHTDRPIAPDELRGLLEQQPEHPCVTAAHLKSETDVRRGATWQARRRAAGDLEARVRREDVAPDLLLKLLQMSSAAPPS
jgi:transcription termination factor NusB